MLTLLVAMLMVTVSAIGFGLALFGRRPVPQPAMSGAEEHLGVALTEQGPSFDAGPGTGRDDLGVTGPWWRRLLARDGTAERRFSTDVTLSGWQRARSALLLAVTVVGLAALVGGVLSVLVVGAVLLLT